MLFRSNQLKLENDLQNALREIRTLDADIKKCLKHCVNDGKFRDASQAMIEQVKGKQAQQETVTVEINDTVEKIREEIDDFHVVIKRLAALALALLASGQIPLAQIGKLFGVGV